MGSTDGPCVDSTTSVGDANERINESRLDETIKEDLTRYYENEMRKLISRINDADSRSISYLSECKSLQNQLSIAHQENESLKLRIIELETIVQNYTSQLSVMSEHLANLNEKIVKQKDTIDELTIKAKTTVFIMASRKAADFTKYLQILPSNIIQHEINKFPVTNPWRSFRKKSAVHPDEAELAEKRSKILSEQKISTIQFPSVTKVLSATMPSESRIALYRWRKKMIAQLGEDGFQQLTQKNFRRGRELHKNIHNKLMAREDRIVINEELEPFWHSLSSVFPMMSDVKLMEGSISHPFLCYKGIVDCVARYEKKPMAIDWKTSTREKPNLSDLYDNPIQVVAYMGALNYDPHHNFQVKNAAIVVAYEDGKSADVHILSSVDIKIYWEKWIQRLSEYWKSQASVKTREDKENISL